MGGAHSGYSSRAYAKFTYFKNDQIKGIQYGNGFIENYMYDSLNRITVEQLNSTNLHTTLLMLSYQYNKTSTVASVVGQINQGSVNEQYRYDALQRLTNPTVTSNGATTTLWYMYDNLGNRIYQKLNGVLTNYTYNISNNELVKSCIVQSPTACSTGTTYSYDSDGNLLTKNMTTRGTQHWYYTWDARGSLLQVKNGTVVSGYYAYDGLGRRVESWDGSFLFYAYLGTDVLAEQNIYGVATDHIFANGFVSTDGQYTIRSYYHTDALGCVRLGTDTNANVIFSDSYQPYCQDNETPIGS